MKRYRAHKLTPEKIIEAFAAENQKISHEQAIAIVKFIETFAKIAVDQFQRTK